MSHSPLVFASLLMVAGGCSFRPSAAPDVTVDAREGDGPDGGGPAVPLCGDDPALVLCLTFDDGDVGNGVANGFEADLARDVSSVAGVVGKAGGFSPTSGLHFPEDGRLDVTTFTLDAFVWLDQPPPTNGSRRVGVIDNDGQYSMFVRQYFPKGAAAERPYAYCNASATVFAPMPTETGRWYHLACVHDGAALAMYVDGVAVPAENAAPPPTNKTNGTTVGQNCDNSPSSVSDPLIGRVDELRIWDRPLSSTEIAAAAARGR